MQTCASSAKDANIHSAAYFCNIYIFIILKGEVTTRNQHYAYILNLTMALIFLRLRFGFNKKLRLIASWLSIIEMGYKISQLVILWIMHLIRLIHIYFHLILIQAETKIV